MAEADERQLLAQAQKGDLACFAQVVELYQARVVAAALRILGDRRLATEAAHEAFVRLYRSLHRVDTGRPFYTYLYRIVVNVCRDLAKRDRRRAGICSWDDETADDADSEADVAGQTESAEFFALVRLLAGRLGVKQRAAFVLRDLEGLEVSEVARVLGCRESTVRSHLTLARRTLREIIEREFPEFLEGR
ncbi:MAG: RNA polymerase sigma factor [candidate division KSB1 bacterium]|nr:RNA polymerase sigma factor [candidate division KSB1 bacterium]